MWSKLCLIIIYILDCWESTKKNIFGRVFLFYRIEFLNYPNGIIGNSELWLSHLGRYQVTVVAVASVFTCPGQTGTAVETLKILRLM